MIARVDPAGFAPAVDPAVAGASPGVAAIGPRAPTLVSESAQPFVHFARPMKADAAALHFELDPPIAGETVWIDPYRAWFVPSELLVLGRSYRVHAHGKVQRDDGSEVVVDQRWELRTRAPFAELEPLQSYGFGRFEDDETEASTFHAKTAVDVRGELEITAAQVRPHLRARAWKVGADPSTAKPVAIRVYGGKQKHPLPADLDEHDRDAVHVHPATSWPAGHEIEVTLDAAFAPKGAGAIGKPVLARFRVSDGTHIRMTCLEDHGDGCGPMGVAFELDAPFTAADLRRIDISPRPKQFKREIWGDNHIWIYGEFELKKYRVHVPELRDRVGQKLVGTKPTELVIVPPQPTVDLVGTSGTLRPGQPTTVGLESRWLQHATLRAAVPSEAEWIAMQHADLDEVPFPSNQKGRIEKQIDLGPSGRFAWSSIALDIAELAGGKGKPLFVEIVPGPVMDVARHRPTPERVRGLYQVTELGLAAWLSPGNARVQVRSFDTLAPLPKVQLEVLDDKGKRVHSVRTGKDGFADLPRDAELSPAAMLLAKSGDDRALARIGIGIERKESDDELLSQIVTERGIYLPGDKVSIVGWGAISTPKSDHGLARPKPGTKVRLELKDPHGDVVVRRNVAFSEHGKYWGRLALPEQAPLGSWSAVATVGDDSFTAYFTVRDVRPPQFEVRSAARDDARTRGEQAEVVTHASYYFGGSVPITNARASSECRLRSTRPPGLAMEWEVATAERGENEPWSRTLAGEPTIEKDGTVRVVVATDELKRGTDYACTTDVAVQDATFEEVGATAAWFVYPTRYLALKGKARVDGHSWELRAVDREGKARRVQRYEVELFRIDDERKKDGSVHDKLVRVQVCKGDTRDHGDDARCDSGKLAPGRYRAVLEAEVDETPVVWSDELWIREPPKTKPRSDVERRWLEMHVEPEKPEPGQTAIVTVLGPKLDAHGELAFSHLGLRRVIPFELRAGEATLELPVTDAWIPGIELHAFAVAPGKDPKAPPQHWSTHARVNVGHESRRLAVTIDAIETTTAGAELPIAVHVKGSDGKPVRGRVAVWAVDEALHSLVAPRIPDLVAGFARGRSLSTRFVENYSKVLRPYVVRDDPFELGGSYGTGSGFGTGKGYGSVGRGGGSGIAQSAVRKKFEGTPIFIGDAEVDAQGNARVKGTMPDNLTTFRLTAIASADAASGPGVARFGHSDARVRVTAPLIVRAVVPRILRPGDEAQIAAMIENLGGPAGDAELEVAIVRGEKLLTIVEQPAAKVTLAAGGQAKVPLLVRARAAGKVELELRVRLPGTPALRDAVRVTLPIEEPKDLRQHAASYGSLDADGAYAIELSKPRELERGAVDVDVEIAGTMLAALEAMARDLAQYPYGCVEQTSSGLVPLVALRGLSHQGFLDVKVDEHVAAGLARLRAMQIDDGGLGYWPGARTVHVWGTAYALWVLELLRAEGHEVPASLRDGMRKKLSERLGLALEQSDAALAPWERLEIDPVAATMAVQALVSAGDRPTALVDALFEHRGELPIFARALLLMAAHEASPKHARTLVTELRAEIDEREGTATVRPGSTWYDEYFDSSARTDAMVLLALLKAAPDDPMIEKLARGVAELRASGGLRNTQERAYGLLALSQYARARETTIPSLTAETWIGAQPSKRASIEGRKTTAVHSHARVDAPQRVTVRRTGKGRLYWRVGMSWTPPDAGAKADAHGMAITRSLRTEKQTDIERVTAGELVALDVTVTVDRTQRYVAIDLPLPPGLEAVDQTLGGGARARVLPSKGGWWVSHRELRRDRAVLFADVLAPGEHTATVFLRATTPGRFEMPAAVAHAMYAPERRGHTADAKVEVTK
ncbi:MAG TPA: MG2 domain-containing protein [Nannocystaceae bacterium]|nr:MG2 domain-containing protein [Nannocystaceae bacterium]